MFGSRLVTTTTRLASRQCLQVHSRYAKDDFATKLCNCVYGCNVTGLLGLSMALRSTVPTD